MIFDRTYIKARPFQIIEYGEGVILKRGAIQIVVTGESVLETILMILTKISGKYCTSQDICDSFSKPRQKEIFELLNDLYEKGFLISQEGQEEITEKKESNSDIFYWHFNLDDKVISEKLSNQKFIIVGVNNLSYGIYQSLTLMGVTNIQVIDYLMLRNMKFFDENDELRNDLWPGIRPFQLENGDDKDFLLDFESKCIISTSDFGGQALLLEWNKFCVNQNIPFLPVFLEENIGFIGPLVIPGETACLQCVRTRQNSHIHNPVLERLWETHASKGQSIAGFHPSTTRVTAETAVFELCHYFGSLSHRRPGIVVKIDLLNGHTQSKKVLKIPRCPVCSPLNYSSEIKIVKSEPLPK